MKNGNFNRPQSKKGKSKTGKIMDSINRTGYIDMKGYRREKNAPIPKNAKPPASQRTVRH